MPAQGTETVGLDLTGNFASKAAEDAQAAREAAAALDKLGVSSAALKGPDTGGASRKIKALEGDILSARAALLKLKAAEAEAGVGYSGKQLAAEQHLGGLVKQLEGAAKLGGTTSFGAGAEALSGSMRDGVGYAEASSAALGVGGALLGAAWEKGKEAASWILAKTREGIEYGIQKSAERAKQTDILGKLTHGEGELAYRVTMSLAGEKGVDPATAKERVKGLIQAHFNQADTEIQFRAAADIGEVKGAGAADSYLGALEKMSHRGKATERDMRAMAGAGVDLKTILGELAAKGESLEAVELRLKGGKIASEEFARAAASAVTKDLGGIAGKGLDAGINRAKIAVGGLFSGWDTKPLEDATDRIAQAMNSEAGQGLKKSVTEVGNEVIGLVKNISKEDMKSALNSASEAAHSLADGIRMASEMAHDLAKTGKELGIISETVTAKKDPSEEGGYDLDSKIKTRKTKPEEDAAVEEAKRAGADIAQGYADGISGGAPVVASAVKGTLDAGVQAGNKTLDRHSPSKVYAEMGEDSGLGYVAGTKRAGDAVEAAGAGIARRSVAGAAGGAGGAGAAPGGGASIQINLGGIVVHSTGSSGHELGASIMADIEPRIAAALRRLQRDGREFGGSASTRIA